MSWSKVGVAITAMVIGSMNIGCGVSPAYEPEPKFALAPPPPASSEELAQRTQESQDATSGDVVVGATSDEYSDTDPSALTEWKPVLDPHGRWVDDPTYGTVWIPAEQEVGTDFQPYVSAGHWTYSDSTSWVWVSDYSWGWVPFHYGRWVYLPGHGWSWIPGRRYAGAWVTWRYGYGYDYVGWAPMGPDYYWYNGWAVGWSFGWYRPYYYYCHHQHIYAPGVSGYVSRGGTPAAAPHEGRTTPYSPASPGVGGNGRVAAQPNVNDRVTASPSVNAVGAGSRVPAQPGVGPKPGEMGIKAIAPEPPSNHAGLERAQAFSTPRTATPLGAAPPSVQRPRRMEGDGSGPRRVDPDAVATAPRPGGPSRVSPSVASRLEPAARAPQVSGVNPVPPRQASPSFAERPPVANGSRSLGESPYAPSRPMPNMPPSSPSFGNAPSHGVHPSSPPSVSHATPSAPSFGGGSPTYRPSAPSVSHSSPSFGGGSTYRPSAPSVSHSSPSAGVSRSATPSAPRVSAPSSPSRSTSASSSRKR